jgi:hypothetical protein
VFAQDVTVSLGDDRPGAIAHVLAVLAAADLNLEGFAVIEGLMHLVTTDASVARRALEGAGVRVRRQCDVLVVDAPNAVGAAALVFRRISDAGINVSFTYVAANDRVVIAVDRFHELAMLDLSPGG